VYEAYLDRYLRILASNSAERKSFHCDSLPGMCIEGLKHHRKPSATYLSPEVLMMGIQRVSSTLPRRKTLHCKLT
jgi:hypothetical protein